MNHQEQNSNDEMLSQQEEVVATRKVPANERNRHGGLVFTTSNHQRGNTTVEECDTDTDQQQQN